jgi:hypothetical protein
MVEEGEARNDVWSEPGACKKLFAPKVESTMANL